MSLTHANDLHININKCAAEVDKVCSKQILSSTHSPLLLTSSATLVPKQTLSLWSSRPADERTAPTLASRSKIDRSGKRKSSSPSLALATDAAAADRERTSHWDLYVLAQYRPMATRRRERLCLWTRARVCLFTGSVVCAAAAAAARRGSGSAKAYLMRLVMARLRDGVKAHCHVSLIRSAAITTSLR